MRALDTNVLVRVLTRDDPEQAAVAADAMRAGPVYVSVTVLLETEWVLRHAYGFERGPVGDALLAVVNLDGAAVEDAGAVRVALRWHARGMDFADALHLARSPAVDELLTFDRRFAACADQLGAAPPVRRLA